MSKVFLVLAFVLAFSGHVRADDAKINEGELVYQKWCIPCHGDGDTFPGTIALMAKYKGGVPPVLEHRIDLTPDQVRHFVRKGVSVMPFFRKTEVSDEELEAIAAYLTRNN